MQVCGVICEYNPFHCGHAHHLAQARAQSGCDALVCVMSGWFTQRGEAALLDKWTRARMALLGGADLVLELPALYAVRDAQRFAQAGIDLLDGLGVCTHVSFGVEPDALSDLARLSAQQEDAQVREKLHTGLACGQTLVRARANALQAVYGAQSACLPNQTLAVEYLRALAASASRMQPIPIARVGAGYHDKTPGALASATSIRASVARGALDEAMQSMPPEAFAILQTAWRQGRVQTPDGLDTALLAHLRTTTPDTLALLADIGEGLEHRLSRCAQTAGSRAALLCALKCKRYTYARLSRVVAQSLLGITQSLCTAYPRAPYVRLLGMRRTADSLLTAISHASARPLLTRAADCRTACPPLFALEARAGDLWSLGCMHPDARKGLSDYTAPFLRI